MKFREVQVLALQKEMETLKKVAGRARVRQRKSLGKSGAVIAEQ